MNEGDGSVPFFILTTMANEEKALRVKELVEAILAGEPEYFLVRVHVRPINNISVYIDGDAGVTIEKCVRINRALYKSIVEENVAKDGEFSLEVSSPGIDEPLLLNRQYLKNIGRSIHVETKEAASFDGKLMTADEKGIEVEETRGKGKKKEVVLHFLTYDMIAKTTVNIVF